MRKITETSQMHWKTVQKTEVQWKTRAFFHDDAHRDNGWHFQCGILNTGMLDASIRNHGID
jgi:hypothetical protein